MYLKSWENGDGVERKMMDSSNFSEILEFKSLKYPKHRKKKKFDDGTEKTYLFHFTFDPKVSWKDYVF